MLDPLAFALALFLAPLVVTVAGCLLIVPVFALFVGALPWLLLGTPALLALALSGPLSAARTVPAALAGGLASWLWFTRFGAALGPAGGETGALLLVFCLFFAAVWAGAFSWLYRHFYRNLLI